MTPPRGDEHAAVFAGWSSAGLRVGFDGLIQWATTETTSGERRLWAVVLGLLVLDLVTTAYGLHLGFKESNPVAITLLSEFGFWALVPLKGVSVAVAVVGWMVLPAAYRIIVPILLAVPWAIGSALNGLLILGLATP